MSDATERVKALVRAACVVADGESELGQRARDLLVQSTRLSQQGVELALAQCLETAPTPAEIAALVASVRSAPRVHVILPANVFVAAHRAIALALAAAPEVWVKPSRREPHFARLLAEAAPGLFELTSEIHPAPGDHVWAYGGDTSLAAIRGALPPGAELHAQGHGYGVAVIDAAHVTAETANALADDIVPFDQRGCLSPRAALVIGPPPAAERFAELAATALIEAASRVPLGHVDPQELADARAFRDARRYAGPVFSAGPGIVALSEPNRPALAPVGRHLVVTACPDPLPPLAPRAQDLTSIGIAGPPELEAALSTRFPTARITQLGTMQKPPFDGPADRRRPLP
jgi:hypothetical protein